MARVVAAHGRHAFIETAEGRRVQCHLRGRKADLVVGDLVRWQPAGDEGVIEAVEARRNLLFRQDAWRTKSFAANLDQILLLVAGEPVFSESQLTRALIAAESAGIPALHRPEQDRQAQRRCRRASGCCPTAAMGVQVLEFALKARPATKRWRCCGRCCEGRTTLAAGPQRHRQEHADQPAGAAGAGAGGRNLAGAELGPTHDDAARCGTGWMRRVSGALIDSPGFQEFGLRHIDPAQLATLMPDLRAHLGHCRFYNCMHRHEPGCGVREAVERGDIAAQRYRLYAEILDELTAR